MQVYEKYVNLARDAFSAGDRIAAESYQQYAEHYFRIINDTTDPQRAAPDRPAQDRQGQERQGQERPAQERPEAEQAAGDRSGAEQPKSGRQPYPVNAEQPFVGGGGATPAADGNGQTPAAKPDSPESPEAVETVAAADVVGTPVADGQSDGAPAPEKKAKPRGRGRPRTRAKAGNGAADEAEAESNPAAETSQPCKAGEASS